jgi:hypothetical protein
MTDIVSQGGVQDGTLNIGGLNSRMFAKDGEGSYLGHQPIWVSASFAHMARQLWT